MTQTEKTIEPLEDVEEINPLALIASLERDNAILQAALRKVLKVNPVNLPGGNSNQYFGRKHEQALEICQSTASEALKRLENNPNEQ